MSEPKNKTVLILTLQKVNIESWQQKEKKKWILSLSWECESDHEAYSSGGFVLGLEGEKHKDSLISGEASRDSNSKD